MKSDRIIAVRTAFFAIFALSAICLVARGQNHRATFARFTTKSSTKFAFGEVPVGKSAQETFYFRNTGTDTLFIQSLELRADTAFTIQFATLTIPPQGEGRVIVQFAPQETRSYSGRIAFDVANGVISPILVLRGSGAQSEIQSPNTAEFVRTGFGSNSGDDLRSRQAH